ncbi:uncharacterized protein LOC120325325 isoform X2 [Pipra filicauda]|uniref:Uncharacterized protein LOC120325325 isoform X2 n=1 Tax=Pipra filicauda TaxID=649802 RepID=A0A7R5L8N6_9PASS|nr:uncharacterized protein LOC120325325 isoform X2 [Pipra filicauda]
MFHTCSVLLHGETGAEEGGQGQFGSQGAVLCSGRGGTRALAWPLSPSPGTLSLSSPGVLFPKCFLSLPVLFWGPTTPGPFRGRCSAACCWALPVAGLCLLLGSACCWALPVAGLWNSSSVLLFALPWEAQDPGSVWSLGWAVACVPAIQVLQHHSLGANSPPASLLLLQDRSCPAADSPLCPGVSRAFPVLGAGSLGLVLALGIQIPAQILLDLEMAAGMCPEAAPGWPRCGRIWEQLSPLLSWESLPERAGDAAGMTEHPEEGLPWLCQNQGGPGWIWTWAGLTWAELSTLRGAGVSLDRGIPWMDSG